MSVNLQDGLIGPMAAITTIPAGSQISPATERVYHQSNLIGDWKGTWSSKDKQPVEFKVVNIRGASAQVEYTHNGHTERGIASVDGATITFGDVTIGTKNGSVAALEFSSGTAKKSRDPQQGSRTSRPEQAGRKLERFFESQRSERVLPGRVRQWP